MNFRFKLALTIQIVNLAKKATDQRSKIIDSLRNFRFTLPHKTRETAWRSLMQVSQYQVKP
jgi:hypothetical protein